MMTSSHPSFPESRYGAMGRTLALTALSLALLLSSMLLVPLGSSEVREKDYGKVENAAPMNTPRFNHTATTLKDGTVLVTGGTMDGYGSLNAPELYDPKKDEWTPLPEMRDPRMRHTANLLPSGEVLITGGFKGTGTGHPSGYAFYKGPGNMSLDRCELYDPITRTFEQAPSLNTGRFWQRAVTLDDGRVLVVGGVNVTLAGLSSCEIYDPVNDTWRYTGEMHGPRVRCTATLLSNGSVMVTGGHSGKVKVPIPTCEIFVPSEEKWYRIASMNDARGFHAAVELENGRVLVSGGFAGPNESDTMGAEIYDPIKDEWIKTGHLGTPRHSHFMIPIGSRGVIAYGGSSCTEFYCTVSGLEYYDIEKGEWEDTYMVILGRKWPAETELNDGRVLICGGQTCTDAEGSTNIYSLPGHQREGGEKGSGTGLYVAAGSVLLLAIFFMLIFSIMVRRIKRT